MTPDGDRHDGRADGQRVGARLPDEQTEARRETGEGEARDERQQRDEVLEQRGVGRTDGRTGRDERLGE